MQIHANCRIRRIYFSDRLYSEQELPNEFKLFLPAQKSSPSPSPAEEVIDVNGDMNGEQTNGDIYIEEEEGEEPSN